MAFNSLYKSAEKLIVDNSSAILTGVAVAGTVATAVLTGRAAYRSSEMIAEKNERRFLENDEFMTTKDKVMAVWPEFIPPVGMGAVTIGSIIFANRISSKRIAALAAAYSLSEKSFGEYKEKTLQHLGIKKEEALRDEIAQDKVNLNPIEQTIIIGDGDHLCYDAITGRYFKSTIEKVRQAENKINYEIIHQHAASLSSFYDEIDLPPTSYSDDVGWNMDNLCEILYTSVLTSDGRPCMVIDFKVAPITGYGRIY